MDKDIPEQFLDMGERFVRGAFRPSENEAVLNEMGLAEITHARLVDRHAESDAALCMIEEARRYGAGEALCCKMPASEMVEHRADNGIERSYRDIRLFRTYEGTTHAQHLINARDMARAVWQ